MLSNNQKKEKCCKNKVDDTRNVGMQAARDVKGEAKRDKRETVVNEYY